MPFPNFHAARVADPDNFVRILTLQTLPNGIQILGGPLKSDPSGSGKTQSYRFPKDRFTVERARKWLKDHNIKFTLFEEATGMKGFTTNMRNGDKTADILLYGTVGGEIDGTEVAREIARLVSEGVTDIHQWINSPGGSIIDGFSIIAENQKSSAKIHTHNVGIAASMASLILVSGNKGSRHSTDFAKIMVHEPNLAGETIDETEDETVKNGLIAMKDSIITHLTNNSKESRKTITDMVEAETWIGAHDAKNKHGFIDKIDKTNQKPKNDTEVTVDMMLAMTNEYHENPINFDHNTNPSNTNTMKSITDFLGLNEDANESAILKAIKKIAKNLETKTTELATSETSLTEANETIVAQKLTIKAFEDKQKDLNKTMVEETIDTAIKAGKVDKTKKDELMEKFENNFDGLKLVVESFKTPAQIITDQLTGEGSSELIPADRKDWNFDKWQKEDGAGLNKIKEKNLALFCKMYEAYYDVKHPEDQVAA